LSRCGAVRKGSLVDNQLINEPKASRSRFKLDRRRGSGKGGVMPEIENLKNSAERCFELASSSNFLEEDVALEAFELLTANQYDCVLAHGLGVSL